MKQITFILICLLSVSCMTVERIGRNCDKFEKICTTGSVDTVRIENTIVITERDTIVNFYFPRDTAYIEVPVRIPPRVNKGLVNSKLSYLEAVYAWSTAEVEQSILKHYLESGDTVIRIQLKDALKTIKTLRTELKASSRTVTIKENTKFAMFTIKWFIGSIFIIVIGLVILFFRYKNKLLITGAKLVIGMRKIF